MNSLVSRLAVLDVSPGLLEKVQLGNPLSDADGHDLWEAGVVLKEDDTDGSECCIGYTEDEIQVQIDLLEDIRS